jgi:two-component system CheB/CheR fusion protein
MAEHVAVLDKNGVIVLTNSAWRQFARDNSAEQSIDSLDVGSNYLDVCALDQTASSIHQAIKNILRKETTEFSVKYPCDSPNEKRWFIMHAKAIDHEHYRVVITHSDVTEWEEP